ncbi:MAG TPA: 4Fe-4S dicluster domain-containing protein [Candidatus Baltobacteraceae bacterium]|nr:4Fe-4S dicluster domain-containing protein [Candidatus Baltobacteraceae bacterium]
MRARVMDKAHWLALIDRLRADFDEVIAPFAGRGRDTYFDRVTDANRARVPLHVPNPYYPPKRYVLPPIERLLQIHLNSTPRIQAAVDAPRRAIVGIRSCDTAGIDHLDRFYLGRDFRDGYYAAHRQNLFLVNVVCTDPEVDIDDDCFCMCADTGPAAREHFDLQVMDLGDELLVVAGSVTGEALFADPIFRKGTPAHLARRRDILAHVRTRFKVSTSWYWSTVKAITLGEVADSTWERIGNRCLECGGCSYMCPTCTCFTVTERRLGPDDFERVRIWDACALGGFTRMAGGFNPRRAAHDRRNRRFFRKLAHYFIQRELSVACVGCGRCVEVCHGDIGMPQVVEIVRRTTAESAHAARA